jgi:glycine/D-amino acid oxidase-like deaminating enzyme
MSKSLKNSEDAQIDFNVLPLSAARKLYPFLKIDREDSVVEVAKMAGWLNPRILRKAQLNIASNHGCQSLDDVVVSIHEETIKGQDILVLKLKSGKTRRTKKVLLCTGAFTGCHRLLPPYLQPEVTLVTQSVVFAELDEGERFRLRNMPTMVNVESDSTPYQKKSCYVLPPIKYPDGKWYLKLGHGSQFERILNTPQEIFDWYTKPVPDDFKKGLRDVLRANFPNLIPIGLHYDSCVTTNTANRHPMIDMVTKNIAVAIGGNGYAAKSCDQLGKLGAHLILGKPWPSKYMPFKEMLSYKVKMTKSKL